ncbi:MAG: neutral/alkaline non-lysosomal ceramidase N-terminal domain-containing protein [Pirellulales bacterium]
MFRVVTWFVLIAGVFNTALADDWKVGIATVKITPEEPLQMAGYASRTRPFERVNDDLYAKALALEDADGHRAVIIATDLIGFKAAIAEPICRQITEKTGLARDQILLNSIHTHSGPTLSLDPEPREGFPADDARKTAAYTRALQEKIVDLAARALADLKPARLSAGSGVATFVMNRREVTRDGIILGVNPRGLADRSVPVLRIDNADGDLRAVLFFCACHNTTLGPQNMLLSGDYGGYAQRTVEDQHPGVAALMLLGCAGDANPHPRGTMDLAREHGESLGKEVSRVLGEKLKPIRGPLKTVLQQVAIPLAESPPREELEKMAKTGPGYKQGVARELLALMDKHEKVPTHYTAPIAVWQFGDDLTLVALPGEVVADYVPLLERALGPLDLWIAAYSNDVFGYLPSARVIEEGGYETRGIYSGGPGFFSPQAQDTVINAVRELAHKAGRKMP